MGRRLRVLWVGVAAAALAACSSSAGHRSASSTTAPPPTGAVPTTAATTPATPATTSGAAPAVSSQWLTYHADPSRTGDATGGGSLAHLGLAWSAALDGAAVYGQPVADGGRIFVATEDDDVYALDSAGHVLWHRSLGTPLEDVGRYVCGDISPLGVTSTPVIDASTSTVYVAAEVADGGAPPVHFRLFGLDEATGQVKLDAAADPPVPAGESLTFLQQRAALALGTGRVYVSYGGHDGDCGDYHGWVVGVAENGSAPNVAFDATPQSSGGAVWGGGDGPAIDESSGDVFVTTGNPNSGGPDPWAEAVVKLDPDLHSPPLAVFQDAAATGDEDLSTGNPVLLPGGELFVVGKTDIGYLLRRSDLARVRAISGTVCGSDPDGGPAYDATTDSLYVPCRGRGIQQVSLRTFATGWRAGGVDGAPILAGGDLWALDYGSDLLQELDPRTGAVLQSITLPHDVPTFASPSLADGLLLVGTDDGVVALATGAG